MPSCFFAAASACTRKKIEFANRAIVVQVFSELSLI